MIIYPFPPEELDDATLSQQIKNIAQVLCGVDYNLKFGIESLEEILKIPMKNTWLKSTKYDEWTRTCRVNYLKLVEMGLAGCKEWVFRNNPEATYILVGQIEEPCKERIVEMRALDIKRHKLQPVIEFARDNVPDLLEGKIDEACKNKGYQDSCDYNPCDIHAWGTTTPFPLVIKENYHVYETDDAGKIVNTNIIESYRNYYRANLPKVAKWTRREIPKHLAEMMK